MIEIKIEINSNRDIVILNKANGKLITMSKGKMLLNGKELYDLLDYKIGNKYIVQAIADESINEKERKIFNSIVETIKEIAKEINKIDF